MRLLTLTLVLMAIALIGACALKPARTSHVSPQFTGAAFANPGPMRGYSLGEQARMWWTAMLAKPAGTSPANPVPVRTLTRQALLDAPDNTLVRLGHSTVLLKLAGEFYLTDPVFSVRASPVQWAGPQRFSAPPTPSASRSPSCSRMPVRPGGALSSKPASRILVRSETNGRAGCVQKYCCWVPAG
jgi:hypothetical protein